MQKKTGLEVNSENISSDESEVISLAKQAEDFKYDSTYW